MPLSIIPIALCWAALLISAGKADASGRVVPWPNEFRDSPGALVIGPTSRIVSEGQLSALAAVVAEEMNELVGMKLAVTSGKARAGDIVLVLDKRMSDEAYRLEITDKAVVRGGSYRGVGWGTVTLLQLLGKIGDAASVPRGRVSDKPVASYRGLMVDLARQWHPIDVVRQCVVLCRWYKIKYLQLHLTDDQLWTFPSKLYPQLGAPDTRYTIDQFRDLEEFARVRGVTIVPEIDVPGHSASLVKALPDVVGNTPPTANTICPGKESTYRFLDSLIGEICSVFKSTPYFHIGSDEVDKAGWAACKDCTEYRAKHGIESEEELYRDFIVRANEIVKRHGKQTVAWEGFKVKGKIAVPKDILVIGWESYYELPQNYLKAGYTLFNCSWKPLYVTPGNKWSPEEIYGWNMYRWEHWWEKSAAYPNGIDVAPTPKIIGAQMCSWEQAADAEIPSLRERLPAMSERIWAPKAGRTFADFSSRLQATNAKLDALLRTAR
jgi:hexosaminidase